MSLVGATVEILEELSRERRQLGQQFGRLLKLNDGQPDVAKREEGVLKQAPVYERDLLPANFT